jgi:hypothetical protein
MKIHFMHPSWDKNIRKALFLHLPTITCAGGHTIRKKEKRACRSRYVRST